MLAREALSRGRALLESASVESPRRNAEILLSELLGIKLHHLYMDSRLVIEDEVYQAYLSMIERRTGGEPLAYILGNVEFMGQKLCIESGVFVPRPETEVLCEIVLEQLEGRASPLVADICTGCGAVAIALAMCRPDLVCYGTDISRDAIECARANAKRLGVADRVTFLHSNLAAELRSRGYIGRFDCMAANPPYVKEEEIALLPVEIREQEPAPALNGGPDGLRYYPHIIKDAMILLRPGGLIALEVGEGCASRVVEMIGEAGFDDVSCSRDLNGILRFVIAFKKGTA